MTLKSDLDSAAGPITTPCLLIWNTIGRSIIIEPLYLQPLVSRCWNKNIAWLGNLTTPLRPSCGSLSGFYPGSHDFWGGGDQGHTLQLTPLILLGNINRSQVSSMLNLQSPKYCFSPWWILRYGVGCILVIQVSWEPALHSKWLLQLSGGNPISG